MSTRARQSDYTKKHNDLATLGEVADLVRRATNHAFRRFDEERIAVLEARIAQLEMPWYARLWQRVER